MENKMEKVITRFKVTDRQAAWIEKKEKETGQTKAAIMRNLIQDQMKKGVRR